MREKDIWYWTIKWKSINPYTRNKMISLTIFTFAMHFMTSKINHYYIAWWLIVVMVFMINYCSPFHYKSHYSLTRSPFVRYRTVAAADLISLGLFFIIAQQLLLLPLYVSLSVLIRFFLLSRLGLLSSLTFCRLSCSFSLLFSTCSPSHSLSPNSLHWASRFMIYATLIMHHASCIMHHAQFRVQS